jgi:hypothetical protein
MNLKGYQGATTTASTNTSSTAGKQRGIKRCLYGLSQAVNELRTVNQVLSQPDLCMQENEVFGSYVALALDKLPQREAIMAQNDIQNILTRYRLGVTAVPSPCNYYTSSIPGSYSWPRFTPIDSPSTQPWILKTPPNQKDKKKWGHLQMCFRNE